MTFLQINPVKIDRQLSTPEAPVVVPMDGTFSFINTNPTTAVASTAMPADLDAVMVRSSFRNGHLRVIPSGASPSDAVVTDHRIEKFKWNMIAANPGDTLSFIEVLT